METPIKIRAYLDRCEQCGRALMVNSSPEEGILERICVACGFMSKSLHPTGPTGGLQTLVTIEAKKTWGHGVINLGLRDCGYSANLSYPLLGPINEEQFKAALEKFDDSDYDPNRCYITQWDPDASQLEVLYGSADELPPFFSDDWYFIDRFYRDIFNHLGVYDVELSPLRKHPQRGDAHA